MDYFHYDYYCPYISSTKANTVYCDYGSKMVAPSVAITRKYVQEYCANREGWKKCTISQMITEAYNRKFEIQKEVKKWQREKEKLQKKDS